MDAKLTAEGVRTHSFGIGWRGYRRGEVDLFRDEVAARLEYLENRLIEASSKLDQLGIEDVQELSRELGKVGGDVTAILEEARRSSTDMRARAAADAASWRQEAEAHAQTVQSDAEQASEQLRSDAWREASRMLVDAREEVEGILAAGRQDVLFIRAEAEREVMHLGGEARRDADELVRNARAEADQILAAAEAEAEQIVAAAEQAVAGAVERTRSLEERRTELLKEIDAAELSLDALRSGAVESDQDAPADDDDAGLRWPDSEDGAVRVIAAPSMPTPAPVDADELVAEVERLRSARLDAAAAGPAGRSESDDESGAAAAAGDDDEPGDTDRGMAESARDIAAQEDTVPGRSESAGDESEVESPADPDEVAPQDHADVAAVEPADDRNGRSGGRDELLGSDEPGEQDNELAGLFAQLREPIEPAFGAGDESDEASEEPAEPVAPAEGSAPPLRSVPMSGPPGEGAFELRERLLLPIENASLREVKRHLVELQNRVLEELRTETGRWEPDPDEFLGEMSVGMVSIRSRAFAAGVEAVEQMTGRPAPGVEVPVGDPGTRAFAESLIAAVSKAHAAAVANEAGARERASAISRVFRAWRTDEAERQLRHAAYAAYREGVLAGFVAVGVTAVTAVTEGVPCAECPAGREWAPGAEPPAGTVLPPAHIGCVTTIVPAGMAG